MYNKLNWIKEYLINLEWGHIFNDIDWNLKELMLKSILN